MADLSDAALRDLQNVELLADFECFETMQDTTADSNQLSIISSQNSDLARLKTSIDHFFEQRPEIVNDIKNYFYDDFIVYMLKRTFDPSFTKNDVTQTDRLLQKFFTKYPNHIEIIINNFFDDLKPLIWNIMSSDFKSSYPYVLLLADAIHTLRGWKAVILCLKKSGATYLTSLMYPDQMDLVQQQNNNLAKQSFSDVNKYFLLASFFLLLCSILGSEIFRFLLYYFLGLICTVFALYLFVKF